MAWDSSRPVPWQRLMREWVIYALIMVGILLFVVRDNAIGAIVGILLSGPLYVGLGAVLAKFGYRRKSLREMREESRASSTRDDAPASGSATRSSPDQPRTRPAPTSRTSTGSNRPRSKRRR